MKMAMTASIVVLALSSVCPQAAMAAQREAGPAVTSSFHKSPTMRGSGAGLGGAAGGEVTNPSGNSLINASPSGSTMFPYDGTTGAVR